MSRKWLLSRFAFRSCLPGAVHAPPDAARQRSLPEFCSKNRPLAFCSRWKTHSGARGRACQIELTTRRHVRAVAKVILR